MPTLVSRSMLRRTLVATAGILVLSLPSAAAAQTPAVKYQRAQAREKTARSSPATTPDTLRAIAKAYEVIVRVHPRTGYADNALWQAAGMYALAFEKSGNVRDREQAVRMLSWLKREYPTSALVRQVAAKLAALPSPGRSTPPRTASGGTAARPTVTNTTPAPAPAPPRTAETPAAAAPPVKPAEKTAADVAAAQPAEPEPAPVSVPLPAPALAAAPADETPSSPSVRKITHSRLPKGDRLTIELSSEAVYATRRSANPDRLTVDLVNADVAAGISERVTTLSGVLFRSVQVSRTINRNTRFVLDVTGNPRYSTFPLYNPFRLVIDVESDDVPADDMPPAPVVATKMAPSRSGRIVTDGPAEPAPSAPAAATAPATRAPSPAASAPPSASAAPAPPSATSRGELSIARQLGLGVARIVIDPGHGGHDPGAQANGVTESTLVLDVALRLEKLLVEKPGFEVVLTRRTDQFIPLEERTAIAQREAADMFISIHANSSPQSSTRGLETYYLDFASNPQAEAVAARENASSAQTMRLLPELVKAITLNNKLDESRELARQVQAALVKRLAGPNKAIKDFGVKRAPFVVLIGAEMPSVLAEISFLTNRTDASLLKQAAHRQRIAQALFESIQSYRSSLKKIGTVAAR